MTDTTAQPPADDSIGARPPQRPIFPTQAAPAEPAVPAPAAAPSVAGPITPPPAVTPPTAPVAPPAAAPPTAPVAPPAAVTPAAPTAPLSAQFGTPSPASAPPAPPIPTYEEQLAAANRDAQAGDRNPGRNPGKTLGIVGLVLAIPLALLGLIFSILGLRKSKKAGQGNALAWIGIVLSVLVILGSIAGGIFAFTVLQPAFALAQACAEAGPGQYTDQNGNPVTCE